MTALFTVEGLNAWYTEDKPVIKELTLKLKENTVVGLLGLNGAGKTTLLNVLCGLHDTCKHKTVQYKGAEADLRDNKFKTKRYIVFSEDDSLGYFTFEEYLKYVFKAYGKTIDQNEVNELVKKFNFEEYRKVLLKELSMGNKRKAFLIAGFALKPELLLLDEPVNGLDFTSTEALYELISAYKKHGTILFSSHVLESVTLTCDEVLVLENGHIAKTFSGDEITSENIRDVLKLEGDDKNV